MRDPLDEGSEAVFAGLLHLLLEEVAPEPGAADVVQRCVHDLEKVVWRAVPPSGALWSVLPFGSSVSGFSTRCSDLDVAVCLQGNAEQREPAADILRSIRRELRRRSAGPFEVKCAILRARVPVLKLRYSDRLDVDLSVYNDGAVRNTALLRAYAALGEPVPALGVAVKVWAGARRLCGAGDGHLSSYALVLMAIYFLQVAMVDSLPSLQDAGADMGGSEYAKVRAKGWLPGASIAALVCQFFHFYAREFGWGYEVVSVRLGCREIAGSVEFAALNDREANRLHIEDPYELQRNLRDVLSPVHEQDLRQAFEDMEEAISAGIHLEVFPQIARGAAAALRVGAPAVARRAFEARAPGYLDLRPGDRLEVLHLGDEADEAERDWAYGRNAVAAGAAEGWVPQEALLAGPAQHREEAAPPEGREAAAARGTAAALVRPWPPAAAAARTDIAAAGPGYLRLARGEQVLVEYTGAAGSRDATWAFGSAGAGRGWFPATAVSPREGVLVEPDSEAVEV